MLQRTLKKDINISGIGLHSGKNVKMTIKSAAADSGIIFVRTDLPQRPAIKAVPENVSSSVRGTNLKDLFFTIEHIMSALNSSGISNATIEIDSPEPPAIDGSAVIIYEMIKKAGIKTQFALKKVIKLSSVIAVMDEGKTILAVPSNRFKVTFMINYPVHFIGTQVFSFEPGRDSYEKDIAPARTYGFMNELEALKGKGLALGASVDNAVAISESGYVNALRFKDELVRHKILDLIGDIYLLNADVRAHVIAIRSGHSMNIKLVNKLKEVG